MSYIEISDKGSEENPVQIVFDLGENPHEYNSIGLIPRLQWVGNSPKYLKIEVSDEVLTRSEDITNWILVGSAKGTHSRKRNWMLTMVVTGMIGTLINSL